MCQPAQAVRVWSQDDGGMLLAEEGGVHINASNGVIEGSGSSRFVDAPPFRVRPAQTLAHVRSHTTTLSDPSSLLCRGSSPLCLSRRPAVFQDRIDFSLLTPNKITVNNTNKGWKAFKTGNWNKSQHKISLRVFFLFIYLFFNFFNFNI